MWVTTITRSVEKTLADKKLLKPTPQLSNHVCHDIRVLLIFLGAATQTSVLKRRTFSYLLKNALLCLFWSISSKCKKKNPNM